MILARKDHERVKRVVSHSKGGEENKVINLN